MFNIWTIARREYKAYFASPVAYIVAFLILAVVGGLFTASVFFTMQAMGQVPPPGVQVVTGTLMFLLVFACPALTMRLLSEEQRLGTMELLLTAPVRDWELVVGKWLGSFLFVLTLIALTLIYPVVLNALVDPASTRARCCPATWGWYWSPGHSWPLGWRSLPCSPTRWPPS
jgi:ABC-2 type transport system permease protein